MSLLWTEELLKRLAQTDVIIMTLADVLTCQKCFQCPAMKTTWSLLWLHKSYQRGRIDPCSRSRLQNVLFCVVFSTLFAFPVFRHSEWSVKLIGRWQGKCNYMLIQQEYNKKPTVLWGEKVFKKWTFALKKSTTSQMEGKVVVLQFCSCLIGLFEHF